MKTKELNTLLASVAVLAQKANNAHWNVEGIDMMPYHKLTEEFYEGLLELVDEIAEKVRMQDELPFSTFAEYVQHSAIEEGVTKVWNSKEIAEVFTKDLDTLQGVTQKVPATDTIQPLLDEVYLFIDKYRWIFKSSAK